jgi:hypothetical protein
LVEEPTSKDLKKRSEEKNIYANETSLLTENSEKALRLSISSDSELLILTKTMM